MGAHRLQVRIWDDGLSYHVSGSHGQRTNHDASCLWGVVGGVRRGRGGGRRGTRLRGMMVKLTAKWLKQRGTEIIIRFSSFWERVNLASQQEPS